MFHIFIRILVHCYLTVSRHSPYLCAACLCTQNTKFQGIAGITRAIVYDQHLLFHASFVRLLTVFRVTNSNKTAFKVVFALVILPILALCWRLFFVSDAKEVLKADPSVGVVELRSLDGSWTLGSGVAGYRVDEVLFGRNVTTTGRTQAVSGNLVVDGMNVNGKIIVNLTDITSDSSKRDGQFRGRIMDVARYPEATIEFNGLAEDFDNGSYTTDATLTIKDVSKSIRVGFTVVRSENGIEVTGSAPFLISQWPIDPPSVPGISVEDDALLEFQATFLPSK